MIMVACYFHVQAREIKLGLFFGKEITTLVFSVAEGEYIIYGDCRQVGIARKDFIYHIEYSRGALTIQDTLRLLGTFSRIEFKGVSSNNVFRVRPIFPSLPARESDDNLLLQRELNFIRIINILDLEKYIAGTVETEGGWTASPEFYKAQAILARTFAVKNFYRHGTEGYNVCDAEHCQAYKGKSRMNPEIIVAALATKELILNDKHGNLVNPVYHSNCGGMTSDAFRVWKEPLPHLQPVTDPFCCNSHNAKWETVMSRNEWVAYLISKGFEKDQLQQASLNFTPTVREKFYRIGEKKVEMTDIRRELNLKSAWFSITSEGDKVFLHGKGYGHGVGMCQEGAMEMAKKGYVYVDILHFYFTNVMIDSIPEKK
jgi:stage II sporulation protein D